MSKTGFAKMYMVPATIWDLLRNFTTDFQQRHLDKLNKLNPTNPRAVPPTLNEIASKDITPIESSCGDDGDPPTLPSAPPSIPRRDDSPGSPKQPENIPDLDLDLSPAGRPPIQAPPAFVPLPPQPSGVSLPVDISPKRPLIPRAPEPPVNIPSLKTPSRQIPRGVLTPARLLPPPPSAIPRPITSLDRPYSAQLKNPILKSPSLYNSPYSRTASKIPIQNRPSFKRVSVSDILNRPGQAIPSKEKSSILSDLRERNKQLQIMEDRLPNIDYDYDITPQVAGPSGFVRNPTQLQDSDVEMEFGNPFYGVQPLASCRQPTIQKNKHAPPKK